jgi:hypothetical protein
LPTVGIALLGKLDQPPDDRWRGFLNCTVVIAALAMLSGCWQADRGPLTGRETPAPDDFRFIGRSSPCLLELPREPRTVRVNCFHIDGVLHVHSNRFSKWPRLRGESWVAVARQEPLVRIQIADDIHLMTAVPIDDERARRAILHDRGYWYAWDGISVFRFQPP